MFTCVCGAHFYSVKEITDHQISRKHYGCTHCGKVRAQASAHTTCAQVFTSMKLLQVHEQETRHNNEATF
jgi:5-methylcytosine-specific restriction endonuclease McrA